ncbi:hypothetical protein ACROYT_G014643 [Oculina patagonica]
MSSRFGSTQKTAVQLLGLVPSAIEAGTNVGIAQACDPDNFPNIHMLLRIACTIPVTSADNECSKSTLKLVKGYLRTTMTTVRLSGLALMSIHYEKPVDYDAIVQKFAEQQPRRMLLVDPIFEES